MPQYLEKPVERAPTGDMIKSGGTNKSGDFMDFPLQLVIKVLRTIHHGKMKAEISRGMVCGHLYSFLYLKNVWC